MTNKLTPIAFLVRPDERAQIEAAAQAAGLSLSAYLRHRLGLAPLDHDLSRETAARAGRLGGLARAIAMSGEERSRIARLGATAKKVKRNAAE